MAPALICSRGVISSAKKTGEAYGATSASVFLDFLPHLGGESVGDMELG